jgi:hypothetical protein
LSVGKSPFAQLGEQKAPPEAKTVTIDGKEYRDGDIYIDPKTGQKSRVKVNQ